MDTTELRAFVAAQMRELGHEFLSRDLSDEVLSEFVETYQRLIALARQEPVRVREMKGSAWEDFRMAVPEGGPGEPRHLFADSVVSGSSNPMGIGAVVWRDGEHAVAEATLGRAFEGAPSRAHGGIVAALIDETMGLVTAIHQTLAFTVQLDITYLNPTPLHQPLRARAWLERREGRKLFLRAEVTSGETAIAEASALFIAVDPAKFLNK